MKQIAMFTDGQDLPLFSGTPQKANSATYQPQVHAPQQSFATCRACMDTGRIGDRFCWCEAGQTAKSGLFTYEPQSSQKHFYTGKILKRRIVSNDKLSCVDILAVNNDGIPKICYCYKRDMKIGIGPTLDEAIKDWRENCAVRQIWENERNKR